MPLTRGAAEQTDSLPLARGDCRLHGDGLISNRFRYRIRAKLHVRATWFLRLKKPMPLLTRPVASG